MSHVEIVESRFKVKLDRNAVVLHAYIGVMVVEWDLSWSNMEDLPKNICLHFLWWICGVIVNIIYNDVESFLHGNIGEKIFEVEWAVR